MPEPEDVIALVVAYDGAPFAGFQVQPELETVQGRLEAALATTLGREVRLACAGRTDAGVHAIGQVVSFEATGDEPSLEDLRRSIDALAGDAIVVREARLAIPSFSARHSATGREYVYRIAAGPVAPLFTRRHCWWIKRTLDVPAMREAAAALVGEHDFASFCVSGSAREQSTSREVRSVSLLGESALGEELLAIVVEGRSFLHSMVRVIVGSLVEVGLGRCPASWMREAIEARERAAAGPTAPPHGLVLRRVGYPEDVWR